MMSSSSPGGSNRYQSNQRPSNRGRRFWLALGLFFLVGVTLGAALTLRPWEGGNLEKNSADAADALARAALPPNPFDPEDSRRIEVQIDRKKATAVVRAYEKTKVVATYNGRAGAPGSTETETPGGWFRVTAHLGTIHTAMYRATEGHEYFLKFFLQFQGDYGFHAYKVNDETLRTDEGPTHGCVALKEADATRLYQWAGDGTLVHIVVR